MSYDMVQEDVVPFIKRVGDHVIEGSNNTLIVFGRDRTNGVESGLGSLDSPGKGKGAGSIHAIAGRKDKKGNPDIDNDSAFLYLSMLSEVDKNFSTKFEGDVGKASVAGLKADTVRLVARKDVKIAIDKSESYVHLSKDSCTIKIDGSGFVRIEKGKIVVDGDRVELGEKATEHLIKGDSFMQLYNSHVHSTAVGPTSPPVVLMNPTAHLSSREIFVK